MAVEPSPVVLALAEYSVLKPDGGAAAIRAGAHRDFHPGEQTASQPEGFS